MPASCPTSWKLRGAASRSCPEREAVSRSSGRRISAAPVALLLAVLLAPGALTAPAAAQPAGARQTESQQTPARPAAAQPTRARSQDPAPDLDSRRIRAHLAFLADDLLEGRAPGTRGGNIAARYIAGQLAANGVPPLRGGYRHSVPLVGWRPDARRMSLHFSTREQQTTLRYPQDAVLWVESGSDSVAVAGEVVFVGYGVRAPEYQWDDFEGRDLRGRILVVLASDPPAPPGEPLIFDGPALTYYGRWTYKVEEAARQGAAAVLIVHTPDGAGYGWSVVESSFGQERLALPRDTAAPAVPLQGWITFDAARRVLAAAGLDLPELFVRAARRDFQPVFTGVQAQLRAAGATRRFESPNVIGFVQGGHEARRNEFVILTAHYDGLGIGRPVAGDSIYNGAYDNASGVALLLELAGAFAALPAPPPRSIVFLFTTAEEAGMLGAEWYTRQPPTPLQRTAAVINIDGANLWGETLDASAIGIERSTLGAVFERHAAAMGLRAEAERAPELGLFFRSDHFPFARAGVPALSLGHGIDFRGRPRGWGANVLTRYEAEHYHQPSDRYDPAFDLSGAVQQGRLAFRMAIDIATAAAPPRWHDGQRIRAPSGGR
jgi:Zn-dependent M28 family amino/carboxypeptidase